MIEDLLDVSLAIQSISFAASSESVDLDDLSCLSIHDWDQWQWVRVEVCIGVAFALVVSEDKTLEESCIAIFLFRSTVWPGFYDRVEAFWKFEFCESVFEFLRCLNALYEMIELGTGRMSA